MARFLLLSNGHGEDLSGALIGKELLLLGHHVDALPLVGVGNAYRKAGIEMLGFSKEFSTGGLGYTSLIGRLTEIWQGQLFYLFKRLFRLLKVANRYELLIVVGDIVPIFAAWFSRRPVVTYLVAYSSHYEGRLKLPWPCAFFLASKSFFRIYTRDQLTADDLSIQLGRSVSFLGNPFMDQVLDRQIKELPASKFRLGLLPGSRMPELEKNLLLMLSALEFLPEEIFGRDKITLDMALVPALNNQNLMELLIKKDWRLEQSAYKPNINQLVYKSCRINIQRDAFIEVIQSSDVLLCMAGTAAEQAVGLEKLVLQLPGYGPQFTTSFAEAQRRLLGPTVFCAQGEVGSDLLFQNTAKLIQELLERAKNDQALQLQCKEEAKRRLGTIGGARKIAYAITDFLSDPIFLTLNS